MGTFRYYLDHLKIFVGNIRHFITQDKVKKRLARYGKIVNVVLVSNKDSSKKKNKLRLFYFEDAET